MRLSNVCTLLASVLAAACCAYSAPLNVSSYNMANGATGSFNYRDFTYVPCNGICDVTGSALSGGTGKLTDGISPALDWYQQGQSTEWVGWDSGQALLNPVITFLFSQSVNVDSITIWASNSRSGGVGLPSAVIIDGTSYAVAEDIGNIGPRALVFSGLNLTGASHTVQFNQSSSFQWVMIGEVGFGDGNAAVPEPATLLLASVAIPILLSLRRRGC